MSSATSSGGRPPCPSQKAAERHRQRRHGSEPRPEPTMARRRRDPFRRRPRRHSIHHCRTRSGRTRSGRTRSGRTRTRPRCTPTATNATPPTVMPPTASPTPCHVSDGRRSARTSEALWLRSSRSFSSDVRMIRSRPAGIWGLCCEGRSGGSSMMASKTSTMLLPRNGRSPVAIS